MAAVKTKEPKSFVIKQRNFTQGELSPESVARAELEIYAKGLKMMQNQIILAHGGTATRGGFEHCGWMNAHDFGVFGAAESSKLWPFVFNEDQQYVVEVGTEYARFWQNGAPVYEADQGPIASSWSGGKLWWQLADHGYIAGDYIHFSGITEPSYAALFNDTVWKVTSEFTILKTIQSITKASVAVVKTTTSPHGLTTGDRILVGVLGMVELNYRYFYIEETAAADEFEIYQDAARLVPEDSTEHTAATGGSILDWDKDQFTVIHPVSGVSPDTSLYPAATDGQVKRHVEVALPYSVSDIQDPVKYTGANDVLELTHRDYAMRQIRRLSANSFDVIERVNEPSVAAPTEFWVRSLNDAFSTDFDEPDESYKYAQTYVGFDEHETEAMETFGGGDWPELNDHSIGGTNIVSSIFAEDFVATQGPLGELIVGFDTRIRLFIGYRPAAEYVATTAPTSASPVQIEVLDKEWVFTAIDIDAVSHLTAARVTYPGLDPDFLVTGQKVQLLGLSAGDWFDNYEGDHFYVRQITEFTVDLYLDSDLTQPFTAPLAAADHGSSGATIGGVGVEDGDDVWVYGTGMSQINAKHFTAKNPTAVGSGLTQATRIDLWSEDGTTPEDGSGRDAVVDIQGGVVLNSELGKTDVWKVRVYKKGHKKSFKQYSNSDGEVYSLVTEMTYDVITKDDGTPIPWHDYGQYTQDLSEQPPGPVRVFTKEGDYPAVAEYFGPRLHAGNTTNEPTRGRASGSHQFHNFHFPAITKDDDPFTYLMPGKERNEIEWYVALRDLVILTSGGTYMMGNQDDVLTFANAKAYFQNANGAKGDVKPLIVGDVAIYVQTDGETVRTLHFSPQGIRTYSGEDLSIISEHLFKGHSIVALAYQKHPDSTLWALRDDGVLLGCTYIPSQEIWGWHVHETEGDIKDILCIHEGSEDVLYAMVERDYDGVTAKAMERMHTRRRAESAEDDFYVDAGLSLAEAPLALTAATQASPVVITVTAHSRSAGDTIDIRLADVDKTYDRDGNELGMKGIIGQWKVGTVTANTLELLWPDDSSNLNGTVLDPFVSGPKMMQAVTAISGAEHLKGKEVSILANGSVLAPQTVSATGTLTLTSPASKVHIGLPFKQKLQLLDPDSEGRIQGKTRRTLQATIITNESRAFEAGRSWDKLQPVVPKGTPIYGGLPVEHGSPVQLTLNAAPTHGGEGGLCIQQTDPVKLSVLGVLTKLELGDD